MEYTRVEKCVTAVLDRRETWWAKLPIVTKENTANDWDEALEPCEDVGLLHPRNSRYFITDSPVSAAQKTQRLDEMVYYLVPVGRITRQTIMKEDGGETEIGMRHMVPAQDGAKIMTYISTIKRMMLAGVPFAAIHRRFGGFVCFWQYKKIKEEWILSYAQCEPYGIVHIYDLPGIVNARTWAINGAFQRWCNKNKKKLEMLKEENSHMLYPCFKEFTEKSLLQVFQHKRDYVVRRGCLGCLQACNLNTPTTQLVELH